MMLGFSFNKQRSDLAQDVKIVNNMRALGIDMINEAKSGHPGIVLGAAPIIYTLYAKHLKFNPNDDKWINRDRFVLSAGHGSALLYANLYMAGFDLSLEDLKRFRRIDSKTPGHPEFNVTEGVDCSTGPLGQGIANAVGMAIGEAYLNKLYEKNKLIDFYTYCLCGDGDLMEGICYEATSLAGKLKLNKLILLYDCNKVCLDGFTKDTFIDDIKTRFSSINFNVLESDDTVFNIDMAIKKAKSQTEKPSIIIINTTIGKYSKYEGTNKVHGSILDEEDVKQIHEKLNIRNTPFSVSEEAITSYREQINSRNLPVYKDYMNKIDKLSEEEKEELEKLKKLNADIVFKDFGYDYPEEKQESTREASGKVLNGLALTSKFLIGGSADLSSSNKTYLNEFEKFNRDNYLGKNIFYGVREHAMGAISNGIALVGLKPFASTFLSFSDYLKPAIRMSAMMNLPVTYVFTHDSVTVGEDGKTHQPVEQLISLRSIPNFEVFRPADSNEVIGTYRTIFNGPSAVILSRNKTRILENTSINDVSLGGYILEKEVNTLQGIIIASGEEIELALKVVEYFKNKNIGIRLVSMPSIERFFKNDKKYIEKILPKNINKFIIERSSSYSWYKIENNPDHLFTIDEFGYSGSKEEIDKKTHFEEEYIVAKIEELLK